MRRNLFVIIIIVIVKAILAVDCCYATHSKDNARDTPFDTIRAVFILDRKQVPYSAIREKLEKGELISKEGTAGSKNAIQNFGEKFRYGAAIFESKDNDNSFQLNGKIDAQYNGNPIMLFTFQQDSILSVDTTIIRNGEFHFRGKEYLGDFSIVATGNYPDNVLSSEVVLNRGIIYMQLDSTSKVWGGELNDKLRIYNDSCIILYKQYKQLIDSSQTENAIKMGDCHTKYIYDFMIKNQNNVLGKHTFEQSIGMFELDSTRFEKLCDIFDKEKKSDIVKSCMEYRAIIDQRRQSIGKKYDDFEFQTPEGNSRKLSNYIGKSSYIYLDFWASWCKPCIRDIPQLKEIYEKYKDKGFEIIGISLDNDKDLWLKALKRVDAPWVHLCDFKGSQSEVTEAYHIKVVPCGILLDKNGIIIETSLTGSTFLDKRLQELFNKAQN